MINSMLVILGFCLSLIIVEGFLRIYNPFPYRVKGSRLKLKVNQNYNIKNNNIRGLDTVGKHRKNALGFRGEDIPKYVEKYLTIITVGGSTTECFYVSEGKTWPDILKNKLKKDFRFVWINNAGLDGQSTFGHILLMDDYIEKIRPKVVFFLVGANDVGRDDLNRFDLATVQRTPNECSLKSLGLYIFDHSESLSFFVNIARHIRARLRGFSVHSQADTEEIERLGRINNNDDKLIETLNTLHKKNLNGFRDRLQKLVQVCKQTGIEPIFITQPTLGDSTVFELYNDVTRKSGETNNILVIDLAAKMPKATLYYYDSIHFTNAGTEKVAEIIYNESYLFLSTKFPQGLLGSK